MAKDPIKLDYATPNPAASHSPRLSRLALTSVLCVFAWPAYIFLLMQLSDVMSGPVSLLTLPVYLPVVGVLLACAAFVQIGTRRKQEVVGWSWAAAGLIFNGLWSMILVALSRIDG